MSRRGSPFFETFDAFVGGCPLVGLPDPYGNDGVVVVAVAKSYEARNAEVPDASPVLPVGEGNVERVLLVVSPAPRLSQESLQRGLVRVCGVAAGFLPADR